eukprot:Phypoly_transcript_05527.p1 GENE.Phypoly_transcript_05527~~Phypoly_transcript_05527.p1  ORF type:complete len:408 (+),score=40.75 Phypoly_transcript_05527:99-1322(+)
MNEFTEKEPVFSHSLPFQLLGSSPFTATPNIAGRDVVLLPMEKKEPTRFSSVDLLNSLGDGFKNDEYYDTVDDGKQAALKAAWRNVTIEENKTSLLSTQTKGLIRRGVPDSLRQQVWKALSGWSSLSKERPYLYSDTLRRAFGNSKPPSFFRSYPLFGGIFSPSDHFLIEESEELVRRLLVVIGLDFPSIDYCPCIPDLLQILLAFMGEADTYGVVKCMLERSQDERKYMIVSKYEHMKFSAGFLQVLAKLIPRLHKHITSLLITEKEYHHFLSAWFSRMFVSFFPYQAVLQIFDVYMNEGVKIWYRIALAVLDYNKDELFKCSTSQEFKVALNMLASQCSANFDSLTKAGFAFQLSRTDMEIDYSPPAQMDDLDTVFYRPKISTPSAIIEDDKVCFALIEVFINTS